MIWQGIIFQSFGEAGWSNSFYISAADNLTAMAALQRINTAMLKTQADTVFTVGLRVSDVEVKGDGFTAIPTNNAGSLALGAGVMAPLNLAARYKLTTADGKHRVNHYVHGLRGTDISTLASGQSIPTVPYAALADVIAFQTELKNDTINWQKRTIPPVTAGFSDCILSDTLSIRRVGRPFNLFRGRRRTA